MRDVRPERELLRRKTELDYEVLDSGCCGMAGSFGFEQVNYDLSLAVVERVLIRRMRVARNDTLIIANGFSCREQIRQCTGSEAMYLAEVLVLASGIDMQTIK